MSETLEIPDAVLVSCPKHKFNLARVAACTGCENFCGLQDRFPGSEREFAERYILLCDAEPVRRHILRAVI